jgi:PPM family protein phosphatase
MANTQSLHNFTFGNSTHVGQVRKANEDYFGSFDTPNGYVFLVCDGMGGHVGGAKASQIAVNTIRDFLQSQAFNNCNDALSNALIAANNAILKYTEQYPELRGMGSTCVAVLVKGSDVYYAHVGDSRIYLLSDKQLYQITKDHSFVQMLVDLGEISEKEAESHPRKNEITNALGLPNMKPPTVCLHPIKAAKGDTILLCSDGLTGMVATIDIEKILNTNSDPQSKASKLVEMANIAGGKDNITVQIIHFNNSEYKKTEAQLNGKTGKIKKNILPILIGCILLLTILFIIGQRFLWNQNHQPQKMPDKNIIQPKPEKKPEPIIQTPIKTESPSLKPEIEKKDKLKQTQKVEKKETKTEKPTGNQTEQKNEQKTETPVKSTDQQKADQKTEQKTEQKEAQK